MKKNYFFDTSALVKLYHKENGTDELLKLLEEQPYQIIIFKLTVVEFYSTFIKYRRMKIIDSEQLEFILYSFDSDLTKFQVIEFNNEVVQKAKELLTQFAIKKSLRSLDSLQIASVLKYRDKKLDLFISADKLMNEIASKLDLQVFSFKFL